jgi:hypothetical protein
MVARIIEASHVRDYIVHLTFEDGTTGEVDLRAELYGEVFEPLRNPAYFVCFRVNPDLHTITWPNGADFAPEFLYEKVLSAIVKK